MKYAWQKCPNADVMILHTSIRLPKVRYCPVVGEIESGSHPDAGVDVEDREFVASLRDIDGVVSVNMGDYECQVEKGELFEWDELKPAIVEVFRRRFKPTGTLT